MDKLGQKGFAHLLLILFMVGAIGGTAYFAGSKLVSSNKLGLILGTSSPSATQPEFSNLSASMLQPGNAIFNFSYSGQSSYYNIHASTYPDMSWDVYWSFAAGNSSPITSTNPTKWDKYRCRRTLYWRVVSDAGISSPIQNATIGCSVEPYPFPSSTPQLTPSPVAGVFTDLTAQLTDTQAYFNFRYSGSSVSSYKIDMSTYKDMSWDVYIDFAVSSGPPIALSNPQAKWDKYRCGKTLYWRVYDSTRQITSLIQATTITCDNPTPQPTPTVPIATSANCATIKKMIVDAMWSSCGEIKYDSDADVNKDKKVDGFDTSYLIPRTKGFTDENSCRSYITAGEPSCNTLKQRIQNAMWSSCGEIKYDSDADVNKDKKVDGFDTSYLIPRTKGFTDENSCRSFFNHESISMPTLTPSPTIPPSEVKAVVLIDSRLYDKVKLEMDRYINLAQKKRGFGIVINNVSGIDDWSFLRVKDHVKGLKNQFTALEGVLIVGNIKLPSFYKPRADLTQVKLIGYYYEDLDGVFETKQQPGSTDPKCSEATTPLCNVYGDMTVPPHDFDYVAKGANSGPELWSAYMPVGFGGSESVKNNYDGYAGQLKPYLQKVIRFYEGSIKPSNKFYQVSNQLWDLGQIWSAYGSGNIDFYSINPDPSGTAPAGNSSGNFCLRGKTAQQCYVRAPLENYTDFQSFQSYATSRDWMGENWQIPSIYTSHMQSQIYEFVWVNVHSWAQGSLISSTEAKSLSNGGIVMLGTGCSVAEIKQPFSPSYVNSETYPNSNILLSYLYGSSNFTAAMGDTFNRAQESYFEKLIPFVKNGDYLGKAHFKRKQIQYENSGSSPYELKNQIKEILYGDPFLDFNI